MFAHYRRHRRHRHRRCHHLPNEGSPPNPCIVSKLFFIYYLGEVGCFLSSDPTADKVYESIFAMNYAHFLLVFFSRFPMCTLRVLDVTYFLFLSLEYIGGSYGGVSSLFNPKAAGSYRLLASPPTIRRLIQCQYVSRDHGMSLVVTYSGTES